VTGTLSAIGAGAENTRLINNTLTTNSVAAKVAADLNFGTKSDWFLPSTLELKEMHDALYAPSLPGNLSIRNYWSSTQDPTLNSRADTYWFGSGGLVSPTDKLGAAITLRPIRAYSPDTITVTTVPTFVDSYTVSVDTITMTSGLLSNYQAVVFQRSGLDISQARQDSLRVNTYGATLGLPFTVTILGGSGSGARTQSLVAGSTATGCAIGGDTMTSTSAGACNLQIKKAYSRNYLTESTTATVFFLLWVINQPAPDVSVNIPELPEQKPVDIDTELGLLNAAKDLTPLVVGSLLADKVINQQEDQPTGFSIVPIPGDWRSPEYNMAFTPSEAIDFGNVGMLAGTQFARQPMGLSSLINSLNTPQPQQFGMNEIVGSINDVPMSINDIINNLGQNTMQPFDMNQTIGQLDNAPASLNSIISGIQSQYG
jgi:hypothetical protein